MKVNVGCGDELLSGWLNVDVNVPNRPIPKGVQFQKGSAWDLGVEAESADTIRAISVLEHITPERIPMTLYAWNRALKMGGQVLAAVPDARAVMDLYPEKIETAEDWARHMQCSYELLNTGLESEGVPGMLHASLWTLETAFLYFRAEGFEVTYSRSDVMLPAVRLLIFATKVASHREDMTGGFE